MPKETHPVRRRLRGTTLLPAYVRHRSFEDKSALREFDPQAVTPAVDNVASYMPDDVTRDIARRMHYAAHRMHEAARGSEVNAWQRHYIHLRDQIVLGNRKLIYRAVKRRMHDSRRTDDLIGECHIVLIQAVAAYNPWIGVRFSTYAYTCLVRALSRQAKKSHRDWLGAALPFDILHDGEPGAPFEEESMHENSLGLEIFLREDHPLLTPREKRVLSRRFRFESLPSNPTLETVGRSMGLSKERVRQVQALAIEKLRTAIASENLNLA